MTWDVLYDQAPLSRITKTASPIIATAGTTLLGGALGGLGARKAQGMLDAAGADEATRAAADVDTGTGALGGAGRALGYGVGGSVLGGIGGGLVGGAFGNGPLGMLGGSIAGSLIGDVYGAYRGYRAPIERAEAALNARGHATQKTAGLFMRPSEIGDHRKLAALLEERLNGAAQGAQFKPAEKTRMLKMAAAPTLSTRAIDAGVGAFGGLIATNRLMGRALAEDSPVPPPEEPSGLVGRFRAARDRVLDHGARSAREYPITAHLLGAGAGALALHTAQPRLKERAYSIMRRVG